MCPRKSSPAQPQHVRHAVHPRRLARHPERRAEGAARVNLAARSLVYELEALALARKDHIMIADDVAAAQRREADCAALARAGDAIAPARRHLGEIDAAAPGRRFAEPK